MRRIESDINRLRKDLSRFDAWSKGLWTRPKQRGLSLKRGTGNGERGTGNGERGTGNGECYIFEAICFMSTLQLYHLLGNTCLSQAFPFNSPSIIKSSFPGINVLRRATEVQKVQFFSMHNAVFQGDCSIGNA